MSAVRAVLFVVEDVLVPDHTPDRWQWAWRPQGPLVPERTIRAAIRRSQHDWDRRRWVGLTGAKPAIDPETYREFLRATLAEVAGRRLPETETEAVVDRFLRAPLPRVPAPDVEPTLATLRGRGVRVGAIADVPGPRAGDLLRRAGLDRRLDVIAGSAPDAPWPPGRDAFRAAAEALGARPSECALVGRLYWSDVRASQRAGFTGFLLDRLDWSPRVEERRLRALTELPPLLEGGASAAPAPPGSDPPGPV
jgi:FMN phosphatase YigB (HAD superfamily)